MIFPRIAESEPSPSARLIRAQRPSSFSGHVIATASPESCGVRLDNNHTVIAFHRRGQAAPVPGQRVEVELPFDDVRGWRLSRTPRDSGAK